MNLTSRNWCIQKCCSFALNNFSHLFSNCWFYCARVNQQCSRLYSTTTKYIFFQIFKMVTENLKTKLLKFAVPEYIHTMGGYILGTMGTRGMRGTRETREMRGTRGTRGTRETREMRGMRGTRGTREMRGTRGTREMRGMREMRGSCPPFFFGFFRSILNIIIFKWYCPVTPRMFMCCGYGVRLHSRQTFFRLLLLNFQDPPAYPPQGLLEFPRGWGV